MEASQPFSDSDITSASLGYPPASASAEVHVPPAEVAALSRLSEHLGSLLRGAPGLAFCSDARITIRSDGEETPREVVVHRCILSVRSPFFRVKFAEGATVLDLGKLVTGFEVGYEALEAVLQYVYTGRLDELPRGVAECVDSSCPRHEACWPAVHFMLQVLHAASTFEINELVSVFQRRLLDILEKVAPDDVLSILFVANLSNKLCQKLLLRCVEIIVVSDIDYIALKKKLPPDIVDQIKMFRANLGTEKAENYQFPDKHAKNIHDALDSDDIELVKMLLGEGKTTLDDAKALHYAVAYCDSKITKELLDLGLADVNGKDHRNFTVLHIAAMRKEPEIIMSLLSKGAQLFEMTPDGRTALQICQRLTKSNCNLPEQGKPCPKERLCIELLDPGASSAEVTSVPAEMISDNLLEKLVYLESRGDVPLNLQNFQTANCVSTVLMIHKFDFPMIQVVEAECSLVTVWLAERLYPTEAKAAMKNANVEGTAKFKSNNLSHLCSGNKRSAEDVVKASFKMAEEYSSRIEALTNTVQLGRKFFPRCSIVIEKILGDDLSELSILERINTDERRSRYNEILEEMNTAFTQDKNASEEATSHSPSSKYSRSNRTRVGRK